MATKTIEGIYKTRTLDETVDICCEMYEIFKKSNIKVRRGFNMKKISPAFARRKVGDLVCGYTDLNYPK